MSDFIPLDELGERTTSVDSDIVHIRSTGFIDSFMTLANFFKRITTSTINALTIGASLLVDVISEKTASAGVFVDGVHLKDGGGVLTDTLKYKYYYAATSGAETTGDIADALFVFVPNIGDFMTCSDGWMSFSTLAYKVTSIHRFSATQVRVARVEKDGTSGNVLITTGTLSTGTRIIFMGNLDKTNV